MMLHPNRCGNRCRNFTAGVTYLCGACRHNGILLVMKQDARQWIDIVGCASYVPPASSIIDADTIQAANHLKAMVKEMQNTVFAEVQ